MFIPFRAYALIHARRPFATAPFERWLTLFHETIELGWIGPSATRALADNVARVHSHQMLGREVRFRTDDRTGRIGPSPYSGIMNARPDNSPS